MKHLIFATLLLLATNASAKCAHEWFTFSGKVVDRSGTPLMGALVGISWPEKEGITGPALALTDSKGMYSIRIGFNTYSGKGKIVEDECNLLLTRISVSAQKGRLRSPYRRIAIGPHKKDLLPTLEVFINDDMEPTVRLIRPAGDK